MGHERLYRMNQAIENDNTRLFQMRDNARQMASYSRDAMNTAHLNTRLNFQQHYTPPNENPSPPISNSGGVHIEEHNTGFSGNQYEANTNLSLATPILPCFLLYWSIYTEEEGSGFQTPNVVNLGFEQFNEGNYGFVRQCQFQNSPFHAGRLSFSTMEKEYQLLRSTFEDAGFTDEQIAFLSKKWYIDVLARIRINSFRIELALGSYEDILLSAAASVGAEAAVGNAIYMLPSFYNHDCDPNAHILWIESVNAKLKALRDIEAGEELRICYIDASMACDARRAILSEGFGFDCKCARCMSND